MLRFFLKEKKKKLTFFVVLFRIVCFLSKKQKVIQEYDIFLQKAQSTLSLW